jgi:U3 small nucleolar RNA-associated protein 22
VYNIQSLTIISSFKIINKTGLEEKELKLKLEEDEEEEEEDNDEDYINASARDLFAHTNMSAKTITFKPPSSVKAVGGHSYGGALSFNTNNRGGKDGKEEDTTPAIDVAIEMPSSCFNEKDYLDHRYHLKRMVYLKHIQKQLLMSRKKKNIAKKFVKKCDLTFYQNDNRKPCLTITIDNHERDLKVRVLPCCAANLFPKQRLGPTKSNLKKNEVRFESPRYSQSIAEDAAMHSINEWLQNKYKEVKFLGAASVLIKAWASRRHLFEYSNDGITGFFLSCLLAHMVETSDALSPAMDTNQLVQGFFVTLATAKKNSSGIANSKRTNGSNKSSGELESSSIPNYFTGGVFCDSELDEETKKSWIGAFKVVFLSPCGSLNLASRISQGAIEELVQEAVKSSEVLEQAGRNAFVEVFLTDLPRAVRYDLHMQVEISPTSSLKDVKDISSETRIAEEEIFSIMKIAMNDRADAVRCASIGTSACNANKIWIGVQLNPENGLKVIDVGPPTDNEAEAKTFRAFWGEKSELRRFKDARICEAVVWSFVPASRRHHIPAVAAEYALKKNVKGIDSITWTSKVFDDLLSSSDGSFVAVSEHSKHLLQTLDRLARRMKEMKDVPLKVYNVQPISAAFRGCDPFPPKQHPLMFGIGAGLGKDDEVISACPRTLNVLVQLEGSGRWPEEEKEIIKTKQLMAIEIAEKLKQSFGTPNIVSNDGTVDILHEGYAFRLFLNASNGGPLIREIEAEQAIVSKHAMLLASISSRFPTFPIAVQIAKRWIASHMFSPHVPDEIIELLVAKVFCHPGGLSPPNSREVAFARFLELLCTHPFGILPLVLDPESSGGQTGEDCAVSRDAIKRAEDLLLPLAMKDDVEEEEEKDSDDDDDDNNKENGTKERIIEKKKFKGPPSMVILSPYDLTGTFWTRDRNLDGENVPSVVTLKRLQSIAAKALKTLQTYLENGGNMLTANNNAGEEEEEVMWEKLFRPNVGAFDGVLLFRKSVLPFPDEALFTQAKMRKVLKRAFKTNLSTAADDEEEEDEEEDEDFILHEKKKKRRKELSLTKLPKRLMQLGPEKAREALLVGFDPIKAFLDDSEKRCGNTALFFHDKYGGSFVAVAVKPETLRIHRDVVKLLENDSFVFASSSSSQRVPTKDAILEELATIPGDGIVDGLMKDRR